MESVSSVLLLQGEIPTAFINVDGIRCISPVLELEDIYQITIFYAEGNPVDLVLRDLPYATEVAAAIYKHWVSYTEYQKHVYYEYMLKQMDIF